MKNASRKKTFDLEGDCSLMFSPLLMARGMVLGVYDAVKGKDADLSLNPNYSIIGGSVRELFHKTGYIPSFYTTKFIRDQLRKQQRL